MFPIKIHFKLLFIYSLFFSLKGFATHIVGGEMNYRYLGNNNYEISLTVYRDCYNSQVLFDQPASIGIFDVNNNLIYNSSVYISSQQQVANAINSPCLIPPTNVCYEVANYTYTTTLPPIPGGYTIAYQRCCRNSSIINLANVQGTGATYFATIPDPAITTVNSNPKFINWPPTFICKDAPFTFNHSAIDYEGDSLAYSLFVPYSGADQANPKPSPPNSPPYANVVYLNPYSLTNVFGGAALHIDSVTGILKATPNSLGQFVYGVSVKEYRNGVLLSETLRDFQVNVVSCPRLTVASIFSPTISCGSLVANFLNTSYNASTYQWDFGDPSDPFDTSSIKNPNYAYSDTGDYMATLVAYSGFNPDCNDTARGLVHIYPTFLAQYNIQNKNCDNSFNFIDKSYGVGGVANFWHWDFGDNTNSLDSNPTHVYPNAGSYDVTLITSTDSSCYDTLTKKIIVQKIPVSNFNLQLDTCSYSIVAIDSSLNEATSRWDFGDGNISFDKTPSHRFGSAGNFTIQQIVFTDSFCVDTSFINIDIPPLPSSDFSYSVADCDSNVYFTNFSKLGATYHWDFGDGSESTDNSPSHIYELAGNIPVTLTTTSFYHCNQKITKNINFTSFKEAAYSVAQDSCSGAVNFYDVTNNAVSYYWEFGDGNTSSIKNPVHRYSREGDFMTRLIVNKESTCIDSTSQKVSSETLLGEILYIPNSFTPNGDGKNDYFALSAFRPCVVYSIEIFDRWGTMIYKNDDASTMQWDGTYKGSQIPNDIFVYLLKNGTEVRQGFINLMR